MTFRGFRLKFFTRRTGVLLFLLLLIVNEYLSPVRRFSAAVQYKCSPWIFGFLTDDMYFSIVCFLGLIYYFANVPYLGKNSIYQIQRMGRVRWSLIQAGSGMLGAAAVTVVLFLLSVILVMPRLKLEMGWGKILYTLSMTDAGEKYGDFMGFSYDLIKNKEAWSVTLMAVLVCFLLFSLMGNLMFCLSLWFSRIAAIIVALAGTASVIMEENLYRFPGVVRYLPFVWIRPEKWDKISMNPGEMLGVLVGLNLLFIILGALRIRKVNLYWGDEEI